MSVVVTREFVALVALTLVLSTGTSTLRGDESLVPPAGVAGEVRFASHVAACNCPRCNAASDDVRYCYGPCDGCPPKTLFQWSRCASFTGGPDLDEPLVTDRPDFTEATSTVGLGVAQLEFGYTYVYDSEPGGTLRGHSIPETLLRVGVLAEWLEFRLFFNYLEETTRTVGAGSTLATGSDDIEVGFKIGLTPQEGFLPEMALFPVMTVPTGSRNFTADEVLPGVIWNYGWELNDFLSTAGQSRFDRSLDGVTGDPYVQFAQSWTIAYSLADRIGAYTEWFGLIPSGADTTPTQHFFNGGFTFLVNNDFQLDIRAGVGLNGAAEDYFLGSGGAVRF